MEKNFIKDQVTVVIPVYNEEHFLRQALESVVHQVDRVIIGDNASTDGTEAICREFIEKYNHIIYFRNPENLGSCQNSILCYEKVETEFLFHIGGHDLVPLNYVSELKMTLRENPDAICAYADIQFIDCDGKAFLRQEFNNPQTPFEWGKMIAPYLAESCPLIRATEYILHGYPAYILYGLYRTNEIIQDWTACHPVALCDVIVLFNTLLKGKYIHSSHTEFMFRDIHQTFGLRPNEHLTSAYMTRIIGHNMTYDMVAEYRRGAKILLECFHRAADYGLTAQEKRSLCRRLLLYSGTRWGYSGKFEIDLYLKLMNFYQSIKNFIPSPLRSRYRYIKSILISLIKKQKQTEKKK
jgi:glycosyltransferase involved in cell wall biosynthesis